MGLSYYTTDGGRASDIGEFYTLEEAMEHYRGIPITKRKGFGMTDGIHVLELVKNVPLLPGDSEGEDVLAIELGSRCPPGQTLWRPAKPSAPVWRPWVSATR